MNGNSLKFVAAVVLCISTLISMLFTINFMLQQGSDNIFEAALNGGLGFALSLGQLILVPIFLYFYNRVRLALTIIAGFIFIALTIVSIASSFFYQANSNAKAEKTEMLSDETYKTKISIINDINSQITAHKNQITQIKGHITEKKNHPFYNGNNPLNKKRIDTEIDNLLNDIDSINENINLLVEKKELISNKISNKNEFSYNVNKGFELMGSWFNMNPDEFKTNFYTFVSIALEALMIICAAFLTFESTLNGYDDYPHGNRRPQKRQKNRFKMPVISLPYNFFNTPKTNGIRSSSLGDGASSEGWYNKPTDFGWDKPTINVQQMNEPKKNEDLNNQTSLIEFKNPDINNPLSFYIGDRVVDDQEIFIDLSKSPHMLVSGVSGFGKGNFLKNIIIQISKRKPEHVKMIMTDLKEGSTAFLFKNIPHLLKEAAVDKESAISMLKFICEERERRQKFLVENQCENIDDYIKDKGKLPFPYIVYIIDEVARLTEGSSKTDKQDVFKKLLNITAQARSSGIHTILSTQYPTAEIIHSQIRMNCPDRVCFYVESNTQSRVILGKSGAENINTPGVCMFRQRNHLFEVKTPLSMDKNEIINSNNNTPTHTQINSVVNDDEYIIPDNVVELFGKRNISTKNIPVGDIPLNSIPMDKEGKRQLAKELKNNGESQKKIAEKLKISQGTVSKLLTGSNGNSSKKKHTTNLIK